MSSMNTDIAKHNFKLIEIPLNKFKDEAVPYHLSIYGQHKTAVHKVLIEIVG